MTDLSVIIPTCDRPILLMDAIQCALGQSLPAAEIIVVNNGSQPLEAAKISPQVKVCELEAYIGVSRARNHGAALAKGEYLAFLDDDDLWEKDYLAKVAEVIESQHPDCIITRLDQSSDGKITPYRNADGNLNLAVLLVENPGIGGPTTVVRRESFNQIGGYDRNLRTGEDKSLVIDFLLKGFRVVAAPHIQAIMREVKGTRLTDSTSMAEGVAEFLKKYHSAMLPWQRNFNQLKIHYHRFLAGKNWLEYLRYWPAYLIHSMYRKRNPALPIAPKLALPHFYLQQQKR